MLSTVEDFVEKELGKKVLLNLKKIQTGGNNNKKGRDYENFFQLFRAFELACQDVDHRKHLLSCQELAFIDDICHLDLEKSVKHNFQAKNSSGSAADWTSEITTRCKRQTILDKKFHGISESRNYLLVSCEKKQAINLNKVPVRLSKLNTCIFFPYCKNLVELLDQTNLKNYVSQLIESEDRSNIDFAAKLILGVLQGTDAKSVQSIFEEACSNAFPNIFVNFGNKYDLVQEIPDWVKQIVTASSHKVAYRLQSNRLYLTLDSGLEVSTRLDLILQLSEPDIQRITDYKDLAMLIMSLATRELTDDSVSQDSSPLGGA